MYITIADLQRLRAEALKQAAKRLESAAKAYDPSQASWVLRREAEKLAARASKLEKGDCDL